MIPAFLTALFFAASAALGTRSVRLLGSLQANFWRLFVGTVALTVVANLWGTGLAGPAFWVFFISGVLGFGLGDSALFFAFSRIGSRLAILITQCLAPFIAGVVEWIWLGVIPGIAPMLCAATILAGVAVALAPGRSLHLTRAALWTGILFGILAATGQALGAVVSRKGYEVADAAGFFLDGPTAAFHRILGGFLIGVLLALFGKMLRYYRPPPAPEASITSEPTSPARGRAWPWVVSNGLAGSVLGVSCFQWALSTTPSALVLPIVALAPILVMPMAWVLEGDRPGLRTIGGSLLAVSGAAALAWTSTGA